jgi:signal transduction histidine kinase
VAASQQLLRRRRHVLRALWISSAFLIFVNVAAWWHHLRTRDAFETLHGENLLAVTRAVASGLDSEKIAALRDPQTPEAWETQHRLRKLQDVNELGALFVVDASHRLLFDTRSDISFGADFTYLGEDTLLCLESLRGNEGVGSPHRIDQESFRVATVPLRDLDSSGRPLVTGVVGAEAAASYLSTLRFQENLLVGFGVLSLFGLVAIIGVLGNSVRALMRAQSALRESEELALVGRLAPAIAHEIRNPLEIIKGSADLIQRRYAPDEATDELFEFIPTEVARIDRLVSEFLLLAHPSALQCTEVALASIIRRVVSGLEPRLRTAKIHCDIRGADSIPAINADPDRIEQILLNLLMNALLSIEKSAEADRRIVVSTDVARWKDQRCVCVMVADNGPGIAPVVATHIFEPFFTTRGSGSSGLGLAIARKIARDHRGDLIYESRTSEGACFSLFLPL